MNLENHHVQLTLLAQAAERVYKIAYLLPPVAGVPINQAFTVKLPVPTVLLNAKLMMEIIQATPVSHRMTFMTNLQPLLQYLLAVWEKLSIYTTLNALQFKTVEMNALRQVALLLHSIYPTVGVPGERCTAQGFSLGMSSDPLVMEKAYQLSAQFQALAKAKAAKLFEISSKYDLQIAENLNRVDPTARWDMSNPAVFEREPQLCYMPVHMENFKNPRHSPVGHARTLGKQYIIFG